MQGAYSVFAFAFSLVLRRATVASSTKEKEANWHLVVCNELVYIEDSIMRHSFLAYLVFRFEEFVSCVQQHRAVAVVTVEHTLEKHV